MEILSIVLNVGLVISMIFTGSIWLATKNHKIRMDSNIIAYTLILWGALLGLSLISTLERDVISNISRAGFIMICLSQSIPLTVSYIRSKRRGD
jgi:hypothetical protein